MKSLLLLIFCLVVSGPLWSNSEQALDEIDKLVRLRDYAQAVSRLNKLAEKGDTEAQYRLAGLYRAGKGVEKSLDKAIKLYRSAAQADHARAQYALALLLEKSFPSASQEAQKWYQLAAAQGYAPAELRLQQFQQTRSSTGKSVSREDIFNAIRHNDEILIDALIARGVNLNLIDEQGNTTLVATLLAGWPRLANKLIAVSNQLDRANSAGDRPIHIAAERAYKSTLVALLDNKADINQINARGDNALILAIRSKNADMIKLLLDRGADFNQVNRKQQSALDLAYAPDNPMSKALFASLGIRPATHTKPSGANSLEQFKLAVKKQGSRYRGWPLLNIAIELGEKEITREIIARKPNLAATDAPGNSALHVAARNADPGLLQQLLSAGASVDAVNQGNETALFLAVEADCLECVRLLLKYKANPAIANKLDTTPLSIAIEKNQSSIAAALLSTKTSYVGIHRVVLLAIQKNMDNLASALIQRDPELHLLDDKKRSLLWYSIDQGLAKTSSELVQSGKIDINQRDINGYSPLALAAFKGEIEILRSLISKGADLSTRTNQNNSALMLAVLSGKTELVDFLVKTGIDIDTQNETGDTALMLAAARANKQIVKLLISAGADLQLRNREDLNAFQIANNSGHLEASRLILDSSSLIFKLFN